MISEASAGAAFVIFREFCKEFGAGKSMLTILDDKDCVFITAVVRIRGKPMTWRTYIGDTELAGFRFPEDMGRELAREARQKIGKAAAQGIKDEVI